MYDRQNIGNKLFTCLFTRGYQQGLNFSILAELNDLLDQWKLLSPLSFNCIHFTWLTIYNKGVGNLLVFGNPKSAIYQSYLLPCQVKWVLCLRQKNQIWRQSLFCTPLVENLVLSLICVFLKGNPPLLHCLKKGFQLFFVELPFWPLGAKSAPRALKGVFSSKVEGKQQPSSHKGPVMIGKRLFSLGT